DGLTYLEGKSLHQINQSAEDGTIRAHVDGDVPVIQLMVDAMGEQQLGEFIYFYELFTAVYGTMLGVNPFDQPGVEAYKKAMYQQLGKPS
ncbi:MAG: glucose-6-phosphate isomerase, partial [Balneolaceae bacterium]